MKVKHRLSLLVLVLLCLLLRRSVHAISFLLDRDVRKCIREEVHKDVLVVGEYKLSDTNGQKTDLLVSCTLKHR